MIIAAFTARAFALSPLKNNLSLAALASSASWSSPPAPPSDISRPLQLYKYLVRQTEKLPKDAAKFYKDSIKRGYSQHVDEDDPERLQQIFKRAVEDAEWIVNKYKKKE